MRETHVRLVAFEVHGDTIAEADAALQSKLHGILKMNDPASAIECWWVAEDDRTDGSDNDSAVFVPPGTQAAITRHLTNLNYTPECNLVNPKGGQFGA